MPATNCTAGPEPVKLTTPPVARVPRLAKLSVPVPARLMTSRPGLGVNAPMASVVALPVKLSVPPESPKVEPCSRLPRLVALFKVRVPPGLTVTALGVAFNWPAAPLRVSVPALTVVVPV